MRRTAILTRPFDSLHIFNIENSSCELENFVFPNDICSKGPAGKKTIENP